MNGSGQFGDDFTDFARKTLLRADLLKRAVAIKLFSSIIKDSPTGDPDYWKGKPPKGYVGGRFKGNWNCTINAPDTSRIEAPPGAKTVAEYRNFPTEGQRLADVMKVCQASDRKDVNWLSNSLPYAVRLEYGWSRQSPQGMVRRNHARAKRLIAQELQRVKSST